MNNAQERIRTICRACGHGGCGVYVAVDDGQPAKIYADWEHPISKGYTCKKAHAAIELQHHPDRLLYRCKGLAHAARASGGDCHGMRRSASSCSQSGTTLSWMISARSSSSRVDQSGSLR